MKKSQSALEFLMTYGWAILAVVAAVGVLMYFDIIDLTSYVPETCVVNERSFSCLGKPQMSGDTVAITVINSNPNPVEVSTEGAALSGGCDEAFVCPKGNTSCETTTLPVNPGQEFTVVMKGCDPVEKFTGDVKVEYTDSSTGLISDFSVKVVAWNKARSLGGGGGSTHMGCSNGACVSLPGPGSNVCSLETDCYHMECLSDQCVRINVTGPGNDTQSDTCIIDGHCYVPSGPKLYNLTYYGVSGYDKDTRELRLSFKNNGNSPIGAAIKTRFYHAYEFVSFPDVPVIEYFTVNESKNVVINTLLDDSILIYTSLAFNNFELQVYYGDLLGPYTTLLPVSGYYDFMNSPGFKRDLQVLSVTGSGSPVPQNFTVRVKNISPYALTFRPESISDVSASWTAHQLLPVGISVINPGEEKNFVFTVSSWSGGGSFSNGAVNVVMYYGRANRGFIFYSGYDIYNIGNLGVQMDGTPPFYYIP